MLVRSVSVASDEKKPEQNREEKSIERRIEEETRWSKFKKGITWENFKKNAKAVGIRLVQGTKKLISDFCEPTFFTQDIWEIGPNLKDYVTGIPNAYPIKWATLTHHISQLWPWKNFWNYNKADKSTYNFIDCSYPKAFPLYVRKEFSFAFGSDFYEEDLTIDDAFVGSLNRAGGAPDFVEQGYTWQGFKNLFNEEWKRLINPFRLLSFFTGLTKAFLIGICDGADRAIWGARSLDIMESSKGAKTWKALCYIVFAIPETFIKFVDKWCGEICDGILELAIFITKGLISPARCIGWGIKKGCCGDNTVREIELQPAPGGHHTIIIHEADQRKTPEPETFNQVQSQQTPPSPQSEHRSSVVSPLTLPLHNAQTPQTSARSKPSTPLSHRRRIPDTGEVLAALETRKKRKERKKLATFRSAHALTVESKRTQEAANIALSAGLTMSSSAANVVPGAVDAPIPQRRLSTSAIATGLQKFAAEDQRPTQQRRPQSARPATLSPPASPEDRKKPGTISLPASPRSPSVSQQAQQTDDSLSPHSSPRKSSRQDRAARSGDHLSPRAPQTGHAASVEGYLNPNSPRRPSISHSVHSSQIKRGTLTVPLPAERRKSISKN